MSTQVPSNPTALAALTPKYESNGGGGTPKVFQPDDQIAFSGATPAATAATASSPYGFAQAQADALVTNVREIRAALITAGIMK